MPRVSYERILADFDPYEVACGVEKYVRAMDVISVARVLTEASRDLPPYYRSAIAAELAPKSQLLPARIDAPTFERIVANAQRGEDIREPMIAYLKSNLRAIPLLGEEFSENILHVVRGEQPRPRRLTSIRSSAVLVGALAATGFVLAMLGIRLIEWTRTQPQHVVVLPSPAHVTSKQSQAATTALPHVRTTLKLRNAPRVAAHPSPRHVIATPRKHAVAARPVHARVIAQAPPPSHAHHVRYSHRPPKQPEMSRIALAPEPKPRPHAIVTTNPIEYYYATPKPRRKRGVGPFFSRLFGYIFGHPKQD
ncbi:MAG: hypothetical protein ACXVAS_10725 [Vulcanimicrobiaceae bacterium]